MKLYNTIVIYDYYVVANDGVNAQEALKIWIREGGEPSEVTSLEARDERNIRQSWRDQKPLVGSNVSDDDFEKRVKGRTTLEVFQYIYTKR